MRNAVIFDFDGTLVDSEKSIYECFQRTTKKIAPNRINHAKNILIGPPLRDTASEILGIDNQDKLEQFVKIFVKLHDDQVTQDTKPYPGVSDLLSEFASKKIPMAIASNKRQSPITNLIKHFKWSNYFHSLQCIDNQSKIRNKREMIKDILKKNDLFKGCYFVGDTVNDGLSANINNLKFIKANFGYGKNQDWSKVKISQSINTFLDLKSVIF